MNIKINKNGLLEIERAGKWKNQLCPFVTALECDCGDWCPHFGEPKLTLLMRDPNPNFTHRILLVEEGRIVICHELTLYGDITDERGKE